MALIAPAYRTVNPNYMMPEIILPYTQASGAFDLLPNGEPMVRLGEGDQFVYTRRLDVRQKLSAAQAVANQIPSPDVVASMIGTATYLQRVRWEYDHHQTASAGRWGFSLVEAMRLAGRQGHAQLARIALLDGYQPANGEGLLNANGATFLNLPADPYGNDTVVTYDNGAMAFFLTQQVQQIKTRTNNLGIGRNFTILGPQETLGTFEYNVVQLVQYQRDGAGSSSTAGVTKDILMRNGDKITWAYDDTLKGKGPNGTDIVLIVMPEVANPKANATWNTNKFAELQPGLDATTMQLVDMAAPREITAPMPAGFVDTVSELRITSGWSIRPEAVTVIYMQYQ